ncbi:oxidoreductase [Williamsia sp. 1138]|uniref:SDR family NAD(P)-dependent oxidoreductase n=1 Tax=Williamsia sp. 1138 TaxID=1903117 RepID=UPI000A109904|nr:SDR family NAD(P)-dependent oxidoreductase [Williamsia sp. 1138]OZG26133.1 oxidoreductase [Williamsia sp. 1138]
MTDLSGLNVVVTGGNGGIGLGMAEGIGKAGARIVVWARDASRSEQAISRLAASGIEAYAVTCDVRDEAAVDTAMITTLDLVGHVDGLVANAGVAQPVPFLETSLAVWRDVLQTNLDGTFLTTRAVARHMVESGHPGAMIIVSSLAARLGAPSQSAYATSKAGVLALGRTLSVELARYRIRCNMVLPGWVETEMTAGARESEKFLDATTTRTPIRRWIQPSEFGDLAAFLADPRHAAHTGTEVVVDGGYSIF